MLRRMTIACGMVLGLWLSAFAPATAQQLPMGVTQMCWSGTAYVPCGTSGTGTANSIGITPTDRTITSATGASQTVMAANASRHSLTIVNSGSSNCGIDPTGGTAVIGGAGTLTLTPGGAYTPRVPTLSAVTAICTAGQPLYADEN